MTVAIFIIENPFRPDESELIEADDVCAALAERFPKWPSTARIYDIAGFDVERAQAAFDPAVLAAHDVTPRDEAGIERIMHLDGPLLVSVAPAFPITAIITIAAVVIGAAAAFLLAPKIPSLSNQQQQSPNNSLSARSNTARPNGRIPDIFGTVRAIPDLIAVPYSMFESNIEYEIALLCVGRGQYTISDISDDKTPVDQISGMSVQVYGPYKSPNNASPDIQIGTLIDSPMYNIRRSNGANGQTLNASNYKSYQGVSDIRFGSDYTVQHLPGDNVKFTAYFTLGDMLTITGSTYTHSAVTFDGDGTYLITVLTDDEITLDVTGGMVAEWAKIAGFPGSVTGYLSSDLYVSGAQQVGPIVETVETDGKLILNFEALNGLYKDDGTNQFEFDIGVNVAVTHVDSLGGVISGPVDYPGTLLGSAISKTTVALTLTIEPDFAGIASCIITRTTPKDTAFKGTVVDEVKLRDFYSAGPVTQSDFGNVTIVFAKTIATAGALVIKDRKLNMLATRMIRPRINETDFGGTLVASDSADDIFCAVCMDPYIGARSSSDLDLNNIYGSIQDVAEYFDNVLAKQFGFTFDNDNLSFEETASIVALTAFCTAYRQGRQFRLSFEQATENSVMLFNARNTVPQSQTRTIRFGVLQDHDGAVVDYVDPDDGAPLKFEVPTDMSAKSPMQLDVLGIRSEYLAYLHTWRAWNKMRYQNIALQLEATQEAVLTIRNDRVLASDLTRPQDVIGGEIVAADGTLMTLSDPVELDPDKDWSICIQHYDESVEILACFGTDNPYQVELSAVPRLPLSLDIDNFTRAKYIIVGDTDAAVRSFLVSDRTQASAFTQTMTLINYSFLYYQCDQLELWLDFDATEYLDSAPYHRDGAVGGGGALIADLERGIVYIGAGAGSSVAFPAFDPPESYTKAVWLKRVDLETEGSVLGNSHEAFGFSGSPTFFAGHGASIVSAEIPLANIWYHLVATYDAASTEMLLYFNGALVDQNSSVANRTISQLVGFEDMPGRADDLRLWRRALTAAEIKAVYRATRIDSSMRGALETESGLVITTEDGSGITWG